MSDIKETKAEKWFAEKLQEFWMIKLELGKIEDIINELPHVEDIKTNKHIPKQNFKKAIEELAEQEGAELFFTLDDIVQGKILVKWREVADSIEKLDKDFEYLNERLQEKGLLL